MDLRIEDVWNRSDERVFLFRRTTTEDAYLNRGFFSAGEEIEKNRRVQLFDLRAGRLKGVKDTEIALPIAMTND